MRVWRFPAALVVLTMSLAACGQQTPRPKPTPSPTPVIQVRIGEDRNHVIVTMPLRQVIPSVPPNPAYVAVTFSDTEGVLLGIEGALLFLRATTASGTVTVDRIIGADGVTQGLPADTYTLLAYYQGCDGNCFLLDGEAPFCSAKGVLKANSRYHLTVRVSKRICELTER
jgi:hypothetical protein